MPEIHQEKIIECLRRKRVIYVAISLLIWCDPRLSVVQHNSRETAREREKQREKESSGRDKKVMNSHNTQKEREISSCDMYVHVSLADLYPQL
jgi:hypothetical protein